MIKINSLFDPIPIDFSTTHKPDFLKNKFILNNNEIHIWILEIEKIKDSFFDISSILSPSEIEKAKKFRTFVQQRLFSLSHGYLRLILSAYLFCPPQKIKFKHGPYGKPYLKGFFGNSHKSVHFNMSHSHNAVFYGVTLCSEIGVDLEYVQQGLDWQEIASLVLTQREKKEILLLPTQNSQVKEFYKVWTCKEAFLKAFGTGLNISPSSIETNYLSNPPNSNGNVRRYTIDYLNQTSTIYSFEILPNYISAFSVLDNVKSLRYFNIMQLSD
jgi:4'-phosphopantetheinyl transferase